MRLELPVLAAVTLRTMLSHASPTPSLGDQLDIMVRNAETLAGRHGMTIHEAKTHFRRIGRDDLAEQLHELLLSMARATAPR